MHPSVQSILQFFSYEHLDGGPRSTALQFHNLAYHLADNMPANPELTVALRKLLEAKDCLVRAALSD